MALKEYSRIQKLHSKLLVLLYIFPSNSVRMHFQSSYFLKSAMYETELQKKKTWKEWNGRFSNKII